MSSSVAMALRRMRIFAQQVQGKGNACKRRNEWQDKILQYF